MSEKLSTKDLGELIEKSIKNIKEFLEKNQQGNESERKKSGLLAYWIIDYIKFLSKERKFDSTKLLKYNRGDIVLVNFGYRIGRELGGRHFAFVLDNYNSLKSNIVTVVPFTSKKETTKANFYSYELKHGLYELHSEKLDYITKNSKEELDRLVAEIKVASKEQFEMIQKRLDVISSKLNESKSLKTSMQKLKYGTIVNLAQVTTISKMRILNPKQASDSLNKIKLHTDDLDAISLKLADLYFPKIKDSKDDVFASFKSGIDSRM